MIRSKKKDDVQQKRGATMVIIEKDVQYILSPPPPKKRKQKRKNYTFSTQECPVSICIQSSLITHIQITIYQVQLHCTWVSQSITITTSHILQDFDLRTHQDSVIHVQISNQLCNKQALNKESAYNHTLSQLLNYNFYYLSQL